MILTTELGSKFKIDRAKKTWERLQVEGDHDNPTRTQSGTFLSISHDKVGERLMLLCPPIAKWASMRMVLLAETVAIEE